MFYHPMLHGSFLFMIPAPSIVILFSLNHLLHSFHFPSCLGYPVSQQSAFITLLSFVATFYLHHNSCTALSIFILLNLNHLLYLFHFMSCLAYHFSQRNEHSLLFNPLLPCSFLFLVTPVQSTFTCCHVEGTSLAFHFMFYLYASIVSCCHS